MFILKKVISAFLMPVPVLAMGLILGLYLLWFTRRWKLGRAVLTLTTLLFLAMAMAPVTGALIRPLERAYPTYEPGPTPVRHVVVLGASSVDDPRLPIPSRLSFPSLYRVTEGIRIHRLERGSKLVFSGFTLFDERSNAEIGALTAQSLGVRAGDIIIEPRARDTREESVYLEKIVGEAPFALVTSASHMKRALKLFRARGMHPIPAPCGHQVKERDQASFFQYLPQPLSFYRIHRVVYETLGLAWSRLKYGI